LASHLVALPFEASAARRLRAAASPYRPQRNQSCIVFHAGHGPCRPQLTCSRLVDRLRCSGMNPDTWLADTRISYDTVADSYWNYVRDVIGGRPFLRAALVLFADAVATAGNGPVADLGCGPGHVTAYLHDLGIDAFGIDISTGMIDVARAEHPRLRFEAGSMTALEFADESIAGAIALWSLIHVPDDMVAATLTGFGRVLRRGAPLLLRFHVGEGSRLKTVGYGGHPMKVHVHRRRPAQMSAWLREAGFTVEAEMLLDPESSVPGAFLFARRKPAGA
jgi:SAM-dependent methyltransferase